MQCHVTTRHDTFRPSLTCTTALARSNPIQTLVKLPINLLASPYTLVAAGTSLDQQRCVSACAPRALALTRIRARAQPPGAASSRTHAHTAPPYSPNTFSHNDCRLHFPFSLIAPCRDPSLASLHLNQLRPAWVLQHSPYTVRTKQRRAPMAERPPLSRHDHFTVSLAVFFFFSRSSATRINSPSGAKPGGTGPRPPCCDVRQWR